MYVYKTSELDCSDGAPKIKAAYYKRFEFEAATYKLLDLKAGAGFWNLIRGVAHTHTVVSLTIYFRDGGCN